MPMITKVRRAPQPLPEDPARHLTIAYPDDERLFQQADLQLADVQLRHHALGGHRDGLLLHVSQKPNPNRKAKIRQRMRPPAAGALPSIDGSAHRRSRILFRSAPEPIEIKSAPPRRTSAPALSAPCIASIAESACNSAPARTAVTRHVPGNRPRMTAAGDRRAFAPGTDTRSPDRPSRRRSAEAASAGSLRANPRATDAARPTSAPAECAPGARWPGRRASTPLTHSVTDPGGTSAAGPAIARSPVRAAAAVAGRRSAGRAPTWRAAPAQAAALAADCCNHRDDGVAHLDLLLAR